MVPCNELNCKRYFIARILNAGISYQLMQHNNLVTGWFYGAAISLITIAASSCSGSPQQPTRDLDKAGKNSEHHKPKSSFTDTVKIFSPAAVFYSPDSLQLEKIKVITEPSVFESTVHDCFYQARNSRIVLEKYYPGIPVIEVKNARYLQWVYADGKQDYFDLDEQGDPCGIIIFDGHQSPRVVDMMNIETELGFYFSK